MAGSLSFTSLFSLYPLVFPSFHKEEAHLIFSPVSAGSSNNSTGTRPAGVAGRNYPTASCRGVTNYCTSARVNKSKA